MFETVALTPAALAERCSALTTRRPGSPQGFRGFLLQMGEMEICTASIPYCGTSFFCKGRILRTHLVFLGNPTVLAGSDASAVRTSRLELCTTLYCETRSNLLPHLRHPLPPTPTLSYPSPLPPLPSPIAFGSNHATCSPPIFLLCRERKKKEKKEEKKKEN